MRAPTYLDYSATAPVDPGGRWPSHHICTEFFGSPGSSRSHGQLGAATFLAEAGYEVTMVPCDEYGRVSAKDVADALRTDTALVSVMHANNVVGTMQHLAEITAATRRRGILLHTDATQSVGRMEVNVDYLGVDLLTIAGRKLHATKGIGALYVRSGTPMSPLVFGTVPSQADHS